jgi:hypothetical protein
MVRFHPGPGWLLFIAALSVALFPAAAGKLKPARSFTAVATSSSAIHLQWRDSNSTETGYLIEYSLCGGTFQRLILLRPNSRSYNHVGLVENTLYSYRLTGIQGRARSASRYASVTTPAGTPSPMPGTSASPTPSASPMPSATVATPVISPAAGTYTDSVQVTMACATSGATIRYTTDGSDPTSSSTAYSAAAAPTLASTTTVKARGFQSGLTTSAAAASTFTIVSSSSRLRLSASAASTSSIRLNWLNTAGNQSSGLTIQRSTIGTDTSYANIAATTAGATAYVDTGLSAGALYYYRARPTGSSIAWSYASTAAISSNASALPAPPTSLQVYTAAPLTGEQAQVLVLQWTRNATNETSYLIEKSDDGESFHIEADVPLGSVGTISGVANGRFVDDQALPESTRYYYQIRAKNSAGVSAPTSSVSGVTGSTAAPSAPTDFTAQAAGPNSINLSWSNPSAIEGWRIYLGTGTAAPAYSGTVNDSVSGAAPAVIQPIVQLTAGTEYNFQIDVFRTVNGVLKYSPKTAIASVTTTTASGVQFTNKSAYPIVSLIIDGVERFPTAPQGIPAGTAASPAVFNMSLANGQHTYSAQNGFWDGASRNTLYSYSGTFTVSGGQSSSPPVFNAPTITQLMTQFRNTSGTWTGWYTGSNGFTPVYMKFYANGTCTLTHNPNGTPLQIGSGSYSMQSNGYQGTFVATFTISLTNPSGSVKGTFSGTLSETGGWFGATFPALSPYAIQFNADGP